MRSYEAARSLFGFLAFIAWSVVVIGVIAGLIGATAGASQYGGGPAAILAMLPGIGIGITGFILVAFIQMGRATVDTAEYTQQMLQLSRDQLEVSRQGLKQGGIETAGFAAMNESASAQSEPSFGKMNETAQAPRNTKLTAPEPTSSQGIAILTKDQNGFQLLNEEGSLLEFRGRQFKFVDGKYDLSGVGFQSAKAIKRHLNGLKDLSE